MSTVNDSPSVASAEGEQKTGRANAGNSLPVIVNRNAAKFGFEIKLIPVVIDGCQTAWEQVHICSKVTEVRRDSPEALRAAGLRVPFVDYDPIAAEAEARGRGRFMPGWAGD